MTFNKENLVKAVRPKCTYKGSLSANILEQQKLFLTSGNMDFIQTCNMTFKEQRGKRCFQTH